MGIYNPPVIAPNMFDKGSVIEVVDASWSAAVLKEDDFPLTNILDVTTHLADIDRDTNFTIINYDKPCVFSAAFLTVTDNSEARRLQVCDWAIHRLNPDGSQSHSLKKIQLDAISFAATDPNKYMMFGPIARSVADSDEGFGTMLFSQPTYFPNGVRIVINFPSANQTDPIIYGWTGTKYEWPS